MRRLLPILSGLTLLALTGAEAALRWGYGFGDPPLARPDAEVEYVLAPSASYSRFGNRIEINRHGMRSRDHEPIPGPAERRVLLIGDSLIYGDHHLDQSETIAARLEAALAADQRMAGCAPLAMAAAASSWGPANEAAFLRRVGTQGAEAATILLSAHDLHDTPLHRPDMAHYRTAPSASAITDFLTALLSRLRPAPPNPQPEAIRAEITLAALNDMADRLAAAGLAPLISYMPAAEEPPDEPARAVFANWAASRGLEFMDLREVMAAAGAYQDRLHPSAAGAKAVAAALAPRLLASLRPCG